MHDADSIKWILAKLVEDNNVHALKDALSPNDIIQRGTANSITDSFSFLQKTIQGSHISSDFDKSANTTTSDSESLIKT